MENLNIGVLGGMGLMLLYTCLNSMLKYSQQKKSGIDQES